MNAPSHRVWHCFRLGPARPARFHLLSACCISPTAQSANRHELALSVLSLLLFSSLVRIALSVQLLLSDPHVPCHSRSFTYLPRCDVWALHS